MIKVLKSLFEVSRQESEESQQRNVRLAAAALLVETARANFELQPTELKRLGQLLQSTLELQDDEVNTLVSHAQERVEEATSLYEFTKVLNEHFTPDKKIQLIRAMWSVAYADGDIDKYEEHLIRNVSDLLYVPHSDYIHCKLAAQN
ncbi:MAG: TerB family tellurite resistance protein [Halioglobus sp.]